MQFDFTLNLIWGVLGFFALACVLWFDWRDHTTRPFRSRVLQFVGVALVVTALFPYISATDDILQIGNLSTQLGDKGRESGPHHQLNDLLRLYDSVDSSVVTAQCHFAPELSFVALVLNLGVARIDVSVPQRAGRSPPQRLPA